MVFGLKKVRAHTVNIELSLNVIPGGSLDPHVGYTPCDEAPAARSLYPQVARVRVTHVILPYYTPRFEKNFKHVLNEI